MLKSRRAKFSEKFYSSENFAKDFFLVVKMFGRIRDTQTSETVLLHIKINGKEIRKQNFFTHWILSTVQCVTITRSLSPPVNCM